jgi:hypothetical protein
VHLRHDRAYTITSPNWDTFTSWEWDAERRAGYLSDWDRLWVLEASSSKNDDDKEEDDKEDDDFEDKQPPPPPASVTDEISGQIANGKVVRDYTDDFIDQVAYHMLPAVERSEHY